MLIIGCDYHPSFQYEASAQAEDGSPGCAIGCGARAGTMANGKTSVRTRECPGNLDGTQQVTDVNDWASRCPEQGSSNK